MYAFIYNRLCGWALFLLGFIGFVWGRIGDYFQLTLAESIINLGLGLVAMSAARGRHRYAVLGALGLGLLLFLWGIYGLAQPGTFVGTAEPLENAIHLVVGSWGMYVAVQDVLEWRRSEPQS